MANNGGASRSNERNLTSNLESRFHRISWAPVNRTERDLVTLQTPRPRNLRNLNDYFQVNQNSNSKSETTLSSTSTLTNNGHRTSSPSSLLRTVTTSTTKNNNNNGPTTSSSVYSFEQSPTTNRSSLTDRERFYCSNESWSYSPVNNNNNFERVQVHAKVSSSVSLPQTASSSSKNVNSSVNLSQQNLNNNVAAIILRRRPSPGRTKSDDITHSVITSQPRKSTDSSIVIDSGRRKATRSTSNLCPRCNKCRCSACTTKRSIPSKWICNSSFLCSVDSTVDLLSGMCCIKGCLYHAFGEDQSSNNDASCSSTNSSSAADHQQQRRNNNNLLKFRDEKKKIVKKKCSSNCCLRYSIIGAAATVLTPCLICYYPLKCCGKVASTVYGNYHDYGCRCHERTTTTSNNDNNNVNGSGRQLTRSSSTVLPPPFPESNFFNNDDDQQTTNECGGVGGVIEETKKNNNHNNNRRLFTIQKPR